jgi:hypothetical protein
MMRAGVPREAVQQGREALEAERHAAFRGRPNSDTGGEFTRLPEARQTANSELARWVFRPTTPQLGLG